MSLDLDRRYLGAPRLRVRVDDVLDLLVDARSVREKLIEAESSDDVTHSGLADLIDRIVNVLNHDHRFFRIGYDSRRPPRCRSRRYPSL
jgi:hypothetical protein